MPNRSGPLVSSSVQDSSEKSKAATPLIASAPASAATSRRFEQVVEATSESIVCINREWNCTFANNVARNILRTDDLVGANLWTRFPGNTEEPFASNYRATMERGVPTDFEAYYPAPLDIWFHVYARPVEDGIVIFSSDITSRKRAEALRDATARRLSQVFEVTTDAVISFDREWRYNFLNKRAAKLLQRDDLLGKNLWNEFSGAPDSSTYIHFPRCMEQGISAEFEDYYPAPLNLWFEVQCSPSEDGIVVFFRDITIRRRSEQVLHEQRELITFIQQAARTAFWKLDLATYGLSFDVGSFPVFGHPLSSLTTAEQFRAVTHPDDRATIAGDIQRAIETGDLIENEFRVIDPQGNITWLESRAQTAIVDGKSATLGGMTIDITERKRGESALAASEERYRVLTELSPQSVWTGSPDGQVTYANQGFLDYLGFTLADIGGENWLNAFQSEDRPGVLDTWGNSIQTGAIYEIEARLIEGRTGDARWWSLRALPLRDESGQIVNWLGVAVDIHDRKTAADALHQKQLETERQRAELETLYQTAPIGLALFDPVEFRYLRLNDRQAEIVGLPPTEILGRRLTEIAPIPGLDEMFQQVASGIPIKNALLEGSVAARPDEHRSWNVNYFPVYNVDGTVRAITAASLEITNQKKAEAALIESEKLAAVGRLASSISHEINNPLEAVTNLLYLIANDAALPKSLVSFVEMAQSELQRVCQIATQTLRFHRQAVRATLVTAEDLVGAVLNLYQGRLANSAIKVEARYDTRMPILCLENDIRQVLNNLIANAIDAMRNGGRLIVRAHRVASSQADSNQSTYPAAADPAHRERNSISGGASQIAADSDFRPSRRAGLRIVIADTGHGMSPSVLARVFEPFYTTKALNGTGLGLWISSGIIARHKGRIQIRSSETLPHRGTVFSLFLPDIPETEIEDSRNPEIKVPD